MRDTATAALPDKTTRTHERRQKSRTLISTPVRVRALEGCGPSLDEDTTTVNLSSTGILIESSSRTYTRNMKVRVTLSAGGGPVEKAGRVVRIENLRDGRRSIAIALDLSGTQEHAPVGRNTHSPLVLVVESETAASDFMKEYLSAEGYEVITAETVAQARKVLERRTPSLLIAEIEGDDLPGYSLCSHFKETPHLKPVPIMLITSSAYPSDYAKAHSMGAIVCMAKPFKRERLGHVVRLLAPPPNANQELSTRTADDSRNSSAKKSKPVPAAAARRFSFPSLFRK
jgi:CheY-like chemotaxis protein